MIEKPPYGMPCNNCGLCCKESLCPLAMTILANPITPCPALETREDGTSACGVVVHPEKWIPLGRDPEKARELALRAIGSGIGCDARLIDEPDNAPKSYRWALEKASNDRGVLRRRVVEMWGFRSIRGSGSL